MGVPIQQGAFKFMSMLVISVSMTWAPTVALAGLFGNSDQEIIDSGGTVSEVAPDWRILCFSESQDVFGGVSDHKHCRIDNSDVRGIAVITAEGLKVPKKQPNRARLWLNDGSCVRLRPEYPNHVWSFDFVETQTHDGVVSV